MDGQAPAPAYVPFTLPPSANDVQHTPAPHAATAPPVYATQGAAEPAEPHAQPAHSSGQPAHSTGQPTQYWYPQPAAPPSPPTTPTRSPYITAIDAQLAQQKRQQEASLAQARATIASLDAYTREQQRRTAQLVRRMQGQSAASLRATQQMLKMKHANPLPLYGHPGLPDPYGQAAPPQPYTAPLAPPPAQAYPPPPPPYDHSGQGYAQAGVPAGPHTVYEHSATPQPNTPQLGTPQMHTPQIHTPQMLTPHMYIAQQLPPRPHPSNFTQGVSLAANVIQGVTGAVELLNGNPTGIMGLLGSFGGGTGG